MAKLNFLHICENAFLTDETKNLNLIGIFDTINSSGFPAVHPIFFIVASLSFENDDNHMVSIVIEKDGHKILEGKKMNVKGKNPRIIQRIVNLKFEKDGVYNIQVLEDEKNIGSTILILNKI